MFTEFLQQEAYKSLCARVEEIDKGAAEYMRTEAKDLPSFVPTAGLCSCFTWSETPQGESYWRTLYTAMNGVD